MNSFSVGEIAQKISATIVGDEKKMIHNVAPLYRAIDNELSYLASSVYEKHLKESKAGAVILSKDHALNCTTTALIVSNPELAFAQVAALFNSQKKPTSGIHPTAVIAKTARIHPTASIGALCVIGENVVIGEHTVLLAGVIVNDDTVIGSDCFFYSHVTLCHHVVIHNNVILHSGVVIGADGFGYARDREKSVKIPQLGTVIIFDHVEIGANSCVDRGALDDTVIETGVKLDNFIQIAHNARVGAHTVMAGCTCVGGSAVIGKNCIVGGNSAISSHVTVCDGTILAGGSAATGSINKPGIYASGTGLMPHNEWRKNVVRFRQLDEWVKRINNFMKNKQ